MCSPANVVKVVYRPRAGVSKGKNLMCNTTISVYLLSTVSIFYKSIIVTFHFGI